MKQGFAIVFILSALFLCYCIARAWKSKKAIAKSIRRLLAWGAIGVLANWVLAQSDTEIVCMVAYSVFFASISWMLYFLLRFLLEYCGYYGGKYLRRKWLLALVSLDTLSMLLNLVFHHAFSCHVVVAKGEEFYRITSYTGYHIHLLLSYLIVFFCFLCLVYKICHTPRLYQQKYVLVLIFMTLVVVLDMLYIMTDIPVNISVIFYATLGISVYYCVLFYVPKKLLTQTAFLAMKDMNDALVLFDMDGQCVGINERATEIYGIGPDDAEIIEAKFAAWRKEICDEECEENFYRAVLDRDGKDVYLKVHAKKLLDKKKKYLGAFFVIHDYTEEVERHAQERYRATHDGLTGLYNKDYFFERVAQRLAEDPGEEYLMVCSDIRNFKLVNDVLGTEMGDRLLLGIASALRTRTMKGEIYGRLGNDRFGLLIKKEYFNEQIFTEIPAEIMRKECDETFPMNVYVGVYEITDKRMGVDLMCDRAFMALATIKGNFHITVAYYNDAIRESALREQTLISELPEAMASGQFKLYLQPQVTAEGKVLGAEGLIRWEHPREGLIVPAEFITIFEKSGAIARLDYHVWKLACQQLKKWKERGRTDLYVSINISSKDFYFMDIYKVITELVRDYDISPANLKLEITETAIMMELPKQLEIIQKLRQEGFAVEMDDFGSGYSSLNMLKDICVDVLKIDMAFLGATNDEARGRKILKMVVELAKELGMPVITEGVEQEEQLEFLKRIGCEVFQGYYFAKPMPIHEFEEMYM